MGHQLHPRLSRLSVAGNSSLYEVDAQPGKVSRIFVVTTPETRAICNDPLVVGVRYTSTLRSAGARALKMLQQQSAIDLSERSTVVLHILRGGLNFGLREALFESFQWNNHLSAFVSAQRARMQENPENWHIVENDYRKVILRPVSDLVFGDVVATGTSLEYGINELRRAAEEQAAQIASLNFFTIGGPRSHALVERVHGDPAWRRIGCSRSATIYFEGVFSVAHPSTKMSIKLDGTDLLRTGAILAPEFIDSQYEHPAYPIERCTIYDAGARSFEIPEYRHDVEEYWTKTAALATQGMSYQGLLAERFPELDASRSTQVSLADLCATQLKRIRDELQ